MDRAGLLALVLFAAAACNEHPRARSLEAGPPADRGAADVARAEVGPGSEAGTDAPRVDGPTAPVDGAPDGVAPAPDGPKTIAGLVLQVTFDGAPIGQYSDSAIKSEWKWIKWYQGLKEGRVDVIDGAEAHSGRSLRVLYPKGGVGPSEGGAQWWVTLPQSYDELYCSYRVKFGSGFDFVKGGKLPGLLGGAGNTGGSKPDGTDGWSARMMWRTAGAAVQYVYHPDQPTIYGEDMAWDVGGKRSFKPDTWHLVEHRIVMNTPGQKDGVVQGWWDGTLALDRTNIRFRDVSSFAIDGFYFSTFFGGSDATWAPTKDEYVYFDDFVIATKPITH